jgi:hypothetical protein
MPQWSRDRAANPSKYPDERARARLPREYAALLRKYDHHVVWIGGRAALLLTYQWDLEPEDDEALRFVEVSFTYPKGHPTAPPEVQAAIDLLEFRKA